MTTQEKPKVIIKPPFVGKVILWLSIVVLLVKDYQWILRAYAFGEMPHIVFLMVVGILLVMLFMYSMHDVSFRVVLADDEITFVNLSHVQSLVAHAIQSLQVEKNREKGYDYVNFIIKMQSGLVHKIPVPGGIARRAKNEIKKRYSFTIQP